MIKFDHWFRYYRGLVEPALQTNLPYRETLSNLNLGTKTQGCEGLPTSPKARLRKQTSRKQHHSVQIDSVVEGRNTVVQSTAQRFRILPTAERPKFF